MEPGSLEKGQKKNVLTIGARQSDLARLQAYEVGESLLRENPHLSVKYHFRQSLGDRNQENPLWKMPEKGVFTGDFRESLIRGECDLVVHSWKDLPLECDPFPGSDEKDRGFQQTELIATLKRADVRDLLLFKKSHFDRVSRKKELCLFSSSPRRSYNLSDFFKTGFPVPLNRIYFESVRGNILTRISKLMESEKVDGLIVAKAAIDRLLLAGKGEFLENRKKLLSFLEKCLWQVLPVVQNPTAPGQGALAIEALSGREDLKSLLSSVHCQQTWTEVSHERTVLRNYGGGCHQKIGVTGFHRSYGDMIFLRGEIEKGKVLRKFYLTSSYDNLHLVKERWFHSKKRDYVRPSGVYAHFVARSRAVPKSEVFDPCKDIVWVSGQKTWEDMARRGIWVHGSSESFGEREDRRIDLLAGDLSWLKWTHSGAPCSSGMEIVATYELIPRRFLKGIFDLKNYRNIYWRSGSQFRLAFEKQPDLLAECEHFCGPGNTFDIISEVLREGNIKKQPRIIPMQWIFEKEN